MTGENKLAHGDFTILAEKYAQYRPGYSPFILEAFIALASKQASELVGADIGAGTGIWARSLAKTGATITAVEPNDAMRRHGISQNGSLSIDWKKGSAEATCLQDQSCDFVCMASSFHWPDYTSAIREFARILRPHGLFMALWNTRKIESNPLLVRIENKLYELKPEMKRKSSGRSEFCEGLLERFQKEPVFSDELYLEANHTERQAPETYIGLWESVNDVRVQLGEDRFSEFLNYIKGLVLNESFIEAEYTTRAWIARRRD